MELPYSPEELRQATHDVIAANEPRLLLRPADRVPRLRRARHQPAELPGRRGHRRVAVGRLPRRGGARARRARDDVVVAPHRPEHGAGGGQGARPVPELAARQDGGHEGRATTRRSCSTSRASSPTARARTCSSCATACSRRRPTTRLLPAGHHPRHGHPHRARHGLRGARGRRRAHRPLPRRRGLLHGHGRRDHADPLGRRPRDRRRGRSRSASRASSSPSRPAARELSPEYLDYPAATTATA